MKTLLKTMTIALTLLATSANATSVVEIIPGPFLPMEDGASEIASILLNKQLKSCVDEFQDSGAIVTGLERAFINPETTKYIVSGVMLEEGDIATGMATINITKSIEMGFFGPIYVYSCNVSIAE